MIFPSIIYQIYLLFKTNSKLQELNLSYNQINIESTTKIAEVIEHNTTLQKLNISNCNIPGDRMDAISDSLRNNFTLQELNMSHNNNIMFEGASKIAEVILVNAMLQKLDISSCHIPDDRVVIVSESYKNNKTLQELIISWNNDQVLSIQQIQFVTCLVRILTTVED